MGFILFREIESNKLDKEVLDCGLLGKQVSVHSQKVRLGESSHPCRFFVPSSVGALRALHCHGDSFYFFIKFLLSQPRSSIVIVNFSGRKKQIMTSSGAYAHNFQNLKPTHTDAL